MPLHRRSQIPEQRLYSSKINDTFSSVASEAISEVISSSAGNLTVDVDQTNSELLQTIQDVRENLSGYQGVLTDFQDTVKQSDSLINDTVKTLDQVKDSGNLF